MSKRLIVFLLAAAMIFLCGCSAMFRKEYLSVTEYTEDEQNGFRSGSEDIKDYDQLKSAISSMVKNRVEEDRLFFSDYGSTLQSDLSQACWEVSKETALGSFAVEKIISNPTRIVNYYEATITISYKRTLAEMNAVQNIAGESRLLSHLDQCLTSVTTNTAFRTFDSAITQEYIEASVARAFEENPLSCVLEPKVTAIFYPASGSERIIELNLTYARTQLKLSEMRVDVSNAIDNLVLQYYFEKDAVFSVEAYKALADACTPDPDGSLRANEETLSADLGSSVYGALVENIADSRGIALAYAALCHEAGIECYVVSGTFDQLDHSWNIIRLGDLFYHVDVSVDRNLGIGAAFLRSDSQMQGRYWWNVENYPMCPESINAADVYTVG